MLPLGIGERPTKRPNKKINNLTERTEFQYVTPEGIQEGTKNMLKARYMPGDGKPSTDCSYLWHLGGT